MRQIIVDMVRIDEVFAAKMVWPEGLSEPLHSDKTLGSISTAELGMGGNLYRCTGEDCPLRERDHVTSFS